MKLHELLAKIRNKKECPIEKDIDIYLERFVFEKMPNSGTLSEAFDVSEEDLEGLYADAYAHYNGERYDDALLNFKWLVILDPFVQKYWMGLGGTHQMREEYKKALKSYAMAAVVDSDDPYPHYYAGLCYEATNNKIDKEKAYELAYERAKKYAIYVSLVHKIQTKRSKL
ncbi:MAG: SycD/LcrH family type III secretion system chaperone [Chlamydiia bacterium]|nr:SycD/LcrH family type III secretion system chaperone [Chlamydiia bacterium]